MSRQANPTMIGTFVFVSLVIAIGATIILGNLQLQQSPIKCILYFTGSLYGLDKGAPVSLRGVKIGRVTDIRIDFNYQESNYTIPVYIEIDRQAKTESKTSPLFEENLQRQSLNELIEKGLRAQLKISSLVTGKLYIDLAFHPETEITLHGQNTNIFEIPTLPSGLEQLTQTLTDLPVHDLLTKTNRLLDNVNTILTSQHLSEAMDNFQHAMLEFDELITTMKQDVPALMQHADESLESFDSLSSETTLLVQTAKNELTPLGIQSQKILADADQILFTLHKTLQQLQDMVDETGNITYDFSQTLLEIKQTARSVKNLSELLRQSPESLLFGRKEQPPQN
ncbi:MlaD family protein [Desulfogranum japonicum]|uniref:MlaD family protein n=1 Tax=Desulfogranum japonicum TaxID=231447 RepID=UPI00041DB337|nr:MlaD family protein [Desulfogranum japonicum]